MRRRALLAASMPSGGGGDTGGFKAEFYFDYCEESWGMLHCYRDGDELGVACYNEMERLLEEYGTQTEVFYAELNNPINYGFEVYIEDSLVTKLTHEYGSLYMYTNGVYATVYIMPSGDLNYEY